MLVWQVTVYQATPVRIVNGIKILVSISRPLYQLSTILVIVIALHVEVIYMKNI
jgi:hypothetical protein